MLTSDDLTAQVIDEYAEAACLCQLRERPDERAAVHSALFGTDQPGTAVAADQQSRAPGSGDESPVTETLVPEAGVVQRQRSVGHYLTLLAADPDVAVSEPAYREKLWSPPAPRSDAHGLVAGQWAALVAKDVWQEAICSVWSEFCRTGLAMTRDLGRGLTWDETQQVARGLAEGSSLVDSGARTAELASRLEAGTLTVSDDDGAELDVATAPLEELRQLTSQLDTAMSGLLVLLELARRMDGRSGAGWQQAAHVASAWQPSVAAVVAGLSTHLTDHPTVADTLWWLVSRFVVSAHERIAYSKLPEFTFRFRWEDGLLRFYDLGLGRFPLAAIRRESLALITWDLGLWDGTTDDDRTAALTERGIAFVNEVIG
jgi:hypothetical protein